jgi:DNA helicase-2/ATP-dependent DNA helicase PcrA
MNLNKEQKEAARFLHGICSVVAVPGSGKTRTMMERIALLVTDHKVPPERILGLTFTRNAAEEMRHRLKPLLGATANKVLLSTIHSFCHLLLRNEGYRFEILQGGEQLSFLRSIIKKLRYKDLSPGDLLRQISLAKSNLLSAEELKELYSGDPQMERIARVYEVYELEKKKKMLMDFDDLLVETYRLLLNNDAMREKYRSTFRHVLVDEYQDTNPAQLEILKLLIDEESSDASFWVCADDWQSIYAFTGASIGNVLNFKGMFPRSRQYILSINYRSTPQILKACQNLIDHNTRKIEKILTTINDDGEEVKIMASPDEKAEAEMIVNEIINLTERKDYQLHDIAVLLRSNFQSRVMEEAFLQHEIPYYIENGLNFYKRFEVKVLLGYLRFINNPLSSEGDETLREIINVPNRYIGRSFMDELEEYAEREKLHLYEALKKMFIPLPYVRKNVRELTGLLDALTEDAKKTGPSEMIYLIRNGLNYDWYISEGDIPSPDDSKIANINELQMAANKFKDIRSLLDYTESFKDELSSNKEGVSVMTIHKAKGLEFPVVFVINMLQGIVPNKNGDIEEERRIAFVGLSRAMQVLYLTYSHTYAGRAIKRSQFLDEIQEIC